MSRIVIPVTITHFPEGYYLATSDQLPGLIAQGKTVDETIEIAEDVAKNLIEILYKEGRTPSLETHLQNTYFLDIHMPIPVSV